MRGKQLLCRFVARNSLPRFVQKDFARKKLLSGMFWVFGPLSVGLTALFHFSSDIFVRCCHRSIRTCSSQQFSNNNQHPSIFNPQHIDCPDILFVNLIMKMVGVTLANGMHFSLLLVAFTKTSSKPTPTEHGHFFRWPRKLC